jgi:cyanophycinase
MAPAGKLVLIGGAVDKGSMTAKNREVSLPPVSLHFFERGILKRLILESKRNENSRIEIITTASLIPEEVGTEYLAAFKSLGAKNANVMHITKRDEAFDEETVERIRQSDVVMFTGGDQLRLSSILGGTPLHKLILEKYRNEDFIYAGTSAGAAAASSNMIYEGSSHEALLKGEVKIAGGLGLIDEVIIDTHFVHRGRIGRLFQAVASNPATLGIGLGEDTGLLITGGNMMKAIGSGLVILVDGRMIKDTNIHEVEMGQPISIKNLIVHVMSQHDVYDLATHELIISDPLPEMKMPQDFRMND